MDKPYTKVIYHKVVIDLAFKGGGGPTRNGDPSIERQEDFDKRADRWFRKRMREGGQR